MGVRVGGIGGIMVLRKEQSHATARRRAPFGAYIREKEGGRRFGRLPPSFSDMHENARQR